MFVADGKTRVPAEYSYVGVNKAGIFERTISRLGDATAVEGGFAVSFVTDYQFAPTTKYGNVQGSLSANFTVPDKAAADSTAFRILADEAARVYSVRFYNKALNSAERSQNHFADLVAFYGLDNATLAKVLAYDRYQTKALYAATDTIEIARSGKDAAPGSEYMLLKKALTDAIALAEKSKREEAKEYIYDYVSDGLVAIFDAFSAKSTDGETSVWKPVDLYGVEGYEDYIDPLTYSYSFLNSWKFVDGGVKPVAKSGALNLDSLGALLGTTYTVQEIQSYPNLLVPKVENGVFVNNDQYVSVGDYNSGAIGSLLYGDLNTPNIKPDDTGYGMTLHNVLFGQICFGTTSTYAYLDHVYYTTSAYGATTFKNVVDKNGVSYDNVLVGNGPFTVERTFFRLGVTETVEAGVTSYASHYKVYYQSLPMFRNAAGSNNTASYDITKYPDNKALHYSTKLTVAGGGATQHSIRIYNRELSRAELDHNHMIDLAITSGASLASYEALGAEAKALVASLMGSVSLFSSKATVEAKIEEYKNFSAGNEGGGGAGLVADVLNASGGTLSSLSQAFADLDFSIDKNAAQEIFNKRLTAIWLTYNGFQINDGYLTSDRYVHMKNAYAYLDENNEYFYDRASGKLYLYSDTPVSGFDVEYATLDWMFTLWGVNKLNFENVQFTGTDDYWLTENDYLGGLGGMSPYVTLYGTTGFQDRSALYFNDCSEVRVTGCRFYDLACEGINAAGWNTDFYYANNVFENIGSSALRMGTHNPILSDSTGGSWFEGETGARDVTVINNYFHNIATEYNTPALMITKLDQGVIKNNTVIDCTYTAISLGWDFNYDYKNFDYDNRVNLRNVDVSYNYISGFMTEMGDGGAIYVPLPNQKTSVTDFYINSMHHNYIMFSKNTGDGTGKMVVGIYFDISSSNWYCFENIVAEQSYGAHKDETDLDTYGVSEEEAESKRLSRQGSDYIYLQHIDDQECHNLFVKDNFIINVRATEEDAQFYEVYQSFFDVKDAVKGRNLQEEGTVYIVGVKSIPDYVKGLIAKAGSEGHRGDIALLQSNNY